jgi:hypothetical protein
VKRDYFTISLVLVGAGVLGYTLLSIKDERPKISKNAPVAQRITDPKAVLPAILTKLDQKIHAEDGFIIVTEESGANTYLLPVSSQWLVQCGAGVSIQLGVAANGSQGTVGNEVSVKLFDGLIEKSACAVVAPRVAARLQEKLGR